MISMEDSAEAFVARLYEMMRDEGLAVEIDMTPDHEHWRYVFIDHGQVQYTYAGTLDAEETLLNFLREAIQAYGATKYANGT